MRHGICYINWRYIGYGFVHSFANRIFLIVSNCFPSDFCLFGKVRRVRLSRGDAVGNDVVRVQAALMREPKALV